MNEIGIIFLLGIILVSNVCVGHTSELKTAEKNKYIVIKSKIAKPNNKDWECKIKLKKEDQLFVGISVFHEKVKIISSDGILYESKNSLESWNTTNVDIPEDSYVSSMFFITSEIGWISIQKDSEDVLDINGDESWIYNTTNGGKTWNKQLNGKALQIGKIIFTNENNGWAIGNIRVREKGLRTEFYVLHTKNGGKNWENISDLFMKQHGDFAQDIIPFGLNEAFLLSFRHKIYRVSLDEKKVDLIKEFLDEEQTYIGQLGRFPNGDFWVLGGADSREGRWGVFAVNQSTSWLKYQTDAYLRRGIFIEGNTLIVSGHSRNGGITEDNLTNQFLWASSNGGEIWQPICTDKELPEVSLFLSTEKKNKIWAIGNGSLVYIERKEQ